MGGFGVARTLLGHKLLSNGRGVTCAETELKVKQLLTPCCDDQCLRIAAIEKPGEAFGLRDRVSR